MNKSKTNKVASDSKKKNPDDEEPALTESNRMVQNEDILTDVGRDHNKQFEKEDTLEQPDEDDPVVTLDGKHTNVHNQKHSPIQTKERVDESFRKDKESAKWSAKKEED